MPAPPSDHGQYGVQCEYAGGGSFCGQSGVTGGQTSLGSGSIGGVDGPPPVPPAPALAGLALVLVGGLPPTPGGNVTPGNDHGWSSVDIVGIETNRNKAAAVAPIVIDTEIQDRALTAENRASRPATTCLAAIRAAPYGSVASTIGSRLGSCRDGPTLLGRRPQQRARCRPQLERLARRPHHRLCWWP
jgi:hypothetical protein